jgi:hypothetical protein
MGRVWAQMKNPGSLLEPVKRPGDRVVMPQTWVIAGRFIGSSTSDPIYETVCLDMRIIYIMLNMVLIQYAKYSMLIGQCC